MVFKTFYDALFTTIWRILKSVYPNITYFDADAGIVVLIEKELSGTYLKYLYIGTYLVIGFQYI